LGKLTSADEHLIYTTKAKASELSNTGFTIINDITGAPKMPENKKVLGKVYALNVPAAKTLPAGGLIIETPETPSADAQIGIYNVSKNAWDLLETKVTGSKLSAEAPGAGIFAVLVNQ
jgi:hypothetical protein